MTEKLFVSIRPRRDQNICHEKRRPIRNTICLWYEKDALRAAKFYASVFPDSKVTAVMKAPGDFPSGKKGQVLTGEC